MQLETIKERETTKEIFLAEQTDNLGSDALVGVVHMTMDRIRDGKLDETVPKPLEAFVRAIKEDGAKDVNIGKRVEIAWIIWRKGRELHCEGRPAWTVQVTEEYTRRGGQGDSNTVGDGLAQQFIGL
jgi:hypothetical protein